MRATSPELLTQLIPSPRSPRSADTVSLVSLVPFFHNNRNQPRFTRHDYIASMLHASLALKTGGTLLIFRVFRASENQGFSKHKRSDGFQRETSIDASAKAELTWIFASRGWIVIRALSIVLDRINCLVSGYTRITRYMPSNTRETY